MSAVSYGATDLPQTAPEQIRTWEAGPGLCELYRLYARSLNAAVLSSCRSACEAAGGDADLAEQLAGLEPIVNASTWTAPELAFAYHEGLQAHRGDTHYLRRLAASLRALGASQAPPLVYGAGEGADDWLRPALDLLGGDAIETAVSRDQESWGGSALAHLRSGWPDMAVAVDATVRNLVWLGSKSGRDMHRAQATLGQVFGVIFFGPPRSVVHLLEIIVHETTHLDVMMRTALDPLILNRDAVAQNPYRGTLRPLLRVLHGAVVAARVWVAHDRCLAQFSGSERELCLSLRREAAADLAVGVDGLKAVAECTAQGAALLATLSELNEEIALHGRDEHGNLAGVARPSRGAQ